MATTWKSMGIFLAEMSVATFFIAVHRQPYPEQMHAQREKELSGVKVYKERQKQRQLQEMELELDWLRKNFLRHYEAECRTLHRHGVEVAMGSDGRVHIVNHGMEWREAIKARDAVEARAKEAGIFVAGEMPQDPQDIDLDWAEVHAAKVVVMHKNRKMWERQRRQQLQQQEEEEDEEEEDEAEQDATRGKARSEAALRNLKPPSKGWFGWLGGGSSSPQQQRNQPQQKQPRAALASGQMSDTDDEFDEEEGDATDDES